MNVILHMVMKKKQLQQPKKKNQTQRKTYFCEKRIDRKSCFFISFLFIRISFLLSVLLLIVICRMLAEKLNMTEEEAERWIVNLIRNARLDAKIDSKLVSIISLMLISFA